ncbi:MAG: multifunctional CCA tRNA nucleotidyl transferase/2'3'-cyclic phosphodiesterase/2'nucleotidase/phosphatase [Gammaproteobacteria bacterium]|nr:multifunctional CCA tRNA nucleotidyl transferase/2'3'-cyclic phosphodiesterase/2'nucleotidase/phosphatase [Gammaproteobacteria bacterium]
MQVYLVGGAVRDKLLGLDVTERDWVVIGSTPEEMLTLGYKPVGKDFPVFLHPKTHEEYALARTERKAGKKHGDFIFNASPEVSLEEDLIRRDLTINAMAETTDGSIIDPYNGQDDLHNKVLRHVSAAFSEDPLRVLRIARFMAKFGPLGFSIAPETLTLMQKMVTEGELAHLSQERIWQETLKALRNAQPSAFFTSLERCNALSSYFPHMTQLGIEALKRASAITDEPMVRFAAACYEGLPILRIPADFLALAKLVHQDHLLYSTAHLLTPADLLQLFKQTDALRRPERFKLFLVACEAVDNHAENSAYLLLKLSSLISLRFDDLVLQYQGPALAEKIEARRLQTLNA